MAFRDLLLTLFALPIRGTVGFSWRGDSRPVVSVPPSEASVFAVALNELQELESEPLCHRVAARLLVNNCQLVDGKNDATILTDSGRQVRDFVDSYAASLAICDLERGSFKIPTECTKFREPSLRQIAVRSQPQLHVSPTEINLCLSALAASNAAWSTWISYRHKALRFCEAARCDNEKAQTILIHQKLTKVIARLVDGVEADLQQKMDDLDSRARQVLGNFHELSPQVDHLKDRLAMVEDYLASDLATTVKKSAESTLDALQNAEDLKQLLGMLVATVLEHNDQLASAYELSVQSATTQLSQDIVALAEVVSVATASTAELRGQLELSNQQAASLNKKQDDMEQGFERLLAKKDAVEQVFGEMLISTRSLAAGFEEHSQQLQNATNATNDLLDTLDETVDTASSLKHNLAGVGSTSWWPYIFCPTLTVVLGSYGLEPSPLRNFMLGALGEAIGFVISLPTERFSILTNITSTYL